MSNTDKQEPDNVAWLQSKIKQASEEGNFEDWENYTAMLKQWEKS